MISKHSSEEMHNTFGVYKITNIADGNSTAYVGSTTRSFSHRMSGHIFDLSHNKHGNQRMQRSWNKYGGDSFEFVILEVVPDKNLCHAVEQKWLDKISESTPVFNCGAIAYPSMLGHKHTPEVIAMMRERRRKQAPPNLGKKLTDEQRKYLSLIRKGHPVSDETKLKISIAHTGKRGARLSEECKRKPREMRSHPYPDLVNIFSGHIKCGGDSRARFCEEFRIQSSSMSAMLHNKILHCYGWMPVDRFLELDDRKIGKLKENIRSPYNLGDKSHSVIVLKSVVNEFLAQT